MIDVLLEIPIEPKGMQRAVPRLLPGKDYPVMTTPGPTRKWQAQLAMIASAKLPRGAIDEPVRVDILAIFPRPDRLMRRKDPVGLVWCGSKPDRDNIDKNVLDSLKSFWRDDALVCCGETIKAYSEKTGRARMLIRIRSVAGVDPEACALELGLISETSPAPPPELPLFGGAAT